MNPARSRRRVRVALAGGVLATACGRVNTTPAARPAQPPSGKVTWYTSGDEPTR